MEDFICGLACGGFLVFVLYSYQKAAEEFLLIGELYRVS